MQTIMAVVGGLAIAAAVGMTVLFMDEPSGRAENLSYLPHSRTCTMWRC